MRLGIAGRRVMPFRHGAHAEWATASISVLRLDPAVLSCSMVAMRWAGGMLKTFSQQHFAGFRAESLQAARGHINGAVSNGVILVWNGARCGTALDGWGLAGWSVRAGVGRGVGHGLQQTHATPSGSWFLRSSEPCMNNVQRAVGNGVHSCPQASRAVHSCPQMLVSIHRLPHLPTGVQGTIRRCPFVFRV
eukprot:363269-Chlamydomonas_euryale.AAC.8